jgi:hypothetical protein
MANDAADAEIEMDSAGLYIEESFTDRRVGNVQRLSPVDGDGKPDSSRQTVFIGQTQVMTPAGALPLSFQIEADSLKAAIEKFGDHAQLALADTMEKLEEMRREQASSLIVPGSGGAPGAGRPGGRGGLQVP